MIPQQWNQDVAAALAKAEEGLENLSEEHWAVINFIRDHYEQTKLAPMVALDLQDHRFATAPHLRVVPFRSRQRRLQTGGTAQTGRLRLG